MPRKTSDEIGTLIEKFLRYEELRMEAVRRLDTPKANRHMLKAGEAADALATTPEGRSAIARLLDHPELYVQVSAAEAVMRWDPDRVIPFFGTLLDADLSYIESVDERLDIRFTAKEWLYRHFNVRSSNRNDLIEPLKAYGIALKWRDPPTGLSEHHIGN